MSARFPELRAFLLAPLAAPLGYWAGLVVWHLVRAARGTDGARLPSVWESIRFLGLVLAFGAPVAYAAALVGGTPVYLVLRQAGWLGRAPLCAAGAALGWAVAAVLAPQLRGDLFSIPMPRWAGAALGLLAAEAFWRLHPLRPG